MRKRRRKDRAKSNAAALSTLHIGTLAVHTLFVAFTLLVRRRSLLLYAALSAPSFACEYVLERTGRPRYDADTGALRTAGEDLAAPGLTEYMFDVVWITWASLVAVMMCGNWGWLLWAVLPAYGAYKGFGLLSAARGMMGGGQQQPQQEPEPAQPNRRQRRAA